MSILPRSASANDISRASHGLYSSPPARVERATREAVHVEHGRALVQAARVRGVHYVATTAARAVEDLTDLEALAIQRNPLAEPRLKAIVDTATAACAHLVAETGRP